MDLSNLSATEPKKLLEENKITSVDLVNFYLGNIQKFNEKYNVYLSIRDKDELMKEAESADKERQIGSNKKLLGLPFSIKDSFMTKGTFTTAGDLFLKD